MLFCRKCHTSEVRSWTVATLRWLYLFHSTHTHTPLEKCALFLLWCILKGMNYKCRHSSFRAQPCLHMHVFSTSFPRCFKVSVREFDTHIYITHHIFNIKQSCDCIIIRGKNIVANVLFLYSLLGRCMCVCVCLYLSVLWRNAPAQRMNCCRKSVSVSPIAN